MRVVGNASTSIKSATSTTQIVEIGQVMTWHRDLPDGAAAIVTRHCQTMEQVALDRIVEVSEEWRFLELEDQRYEYVMAPRSDKVCKTEE